MLNVSDTALSSQQLRSHLFLQDCVVNQEVEHFTLDKSQLRVTDKISKLAEAQTLVIFTEGLELEHLLYELQKSIGLNWCY